MGSKAITRTILWIENDKELTTLFTRFLRERLKPHSVDIIVARDMKEAAEHLKGGVSGFALLIVDIMLPIDEAASQATEEMEEQRRHLLRELSEIRDREGASAQKEVRRLRQQIDALDAEWERLTDLEGGVRVLEELSPRPIGVPTIFLTARGEPRLKERARKLIAPGSFHWLQKPIDVDAMVDVLRSCLGKGK